MTKNEIKLALDADPPTCMLADVIDFVQAELQKADTVVVQIGEAKWRVVG